MTKITGDWLTQPETVAVTSALEAAGHQIYYVGGCVRNALLGTSVADIDMATDARPNAVIAAGKAAGLKVVPTGIDHGTVTVVSGGIPHEITTFRDDVQTDGRHATVAFSKTMNEDAKRRDFTMNALYASPDGTVHDPVGGLPDVRARRVRFVGNAQRRIKEDYLRILRFFRFHAWYGDPAEGLDQDSLAACADGLDGLEHLSRERVGSEMVKLLCAPDPAPSVAAMAATGVLNSVMPGADPKPLAPLIHLEGARPVDWRRRAVVLGGGGLKETWRISKNDDRHLTSVKDMIGSAQGLGEIAYRFDPEIAVNTALARAAIFEMACPDTMDADIANGHAAEFPIKAKDLSGITGPQLGERLRDLEDAWIASGFELSKPQLLAL